jgi:hypothetical protein
MNQIENIMEVGVVEMIRMAKKNCKKKNFVLLNLHRLAGKEIKKVADVALYVWVCLKVCS